MFKFLFMTAVVTLSISAEASRSRANSLNAIGGFGLAVPTSATLSQVSGVTLLGSVTTADDEQDTFINPGKMFAFADLLLVEFGGGSTSTNNEGGIFRAHGDAKWGLYFGHKNAYIAPLAATAGGLAEANPFEIFYGAKAPAMKWGVSLFYSDARNNLAAAVGTKTTTTGVRFGAVADVWEAYAQLGLVGKADVSATISATSDLALRFGGQYTLPTIVLYGDLQSVGGKITAAGVDTKMSGMLLTFGAEDKLKGDTAHFFYGVRYISYNARLGDNGSSSSSKLPIYAGLEADAMSWMTLRASVAQSLLINSDKSAANSAGGPSVLDQTGAADTTVGLGAGFKFGKLSIDGAVRVATNGGNFGLDAAGFLNTVALLYNF